MASTIRYEKLGYVALNVTDLKKSTEFYENLVGLKRETDGPDGEVFFRSSNDHHNIVLYQAPEAGLKRIGWKVESAAELQNAFDHFTKIGLAPKEITKAEAKALGLGRAFRICEPKSGVTFEFFDQISQVSDPFEPHPTKIVRLGHIVVNVKDFAAMEKFMLEEMNFRVSDRIEGMVTFMRCFPNPLHHSFALGQADGNRLNHVNFMVTDIDDVGAANNRLRRHEVPIVFGPGRHPPSGSVFLYFLDPDGLTVEYSYGMEEFPEKGARDPRKMKPAPESFDYWGGMPDPRFAAKGRIEAAK